MRMGLLLATTVATAACAPFAAAQPVPPGYYYGPPGPYLGYRRFGPYGYRPWFRRSYGTGYRGRGTLTGGPVGGLPSRN